MRTWGQAQRIAAWSIGAFFLVGMPAIARESSADGTATARQSPSEGDLNPSDLLAREVRQYLSTWLERHADQFDVEPDMQTLARVKSPSGQPVRATIRPLPASVRPSSRMPVWVDLIGSDGLRQSILVTSRVRAFRQAWVANQDLSPGVHLNPQVLERREIDIAAAGTTPWQGNPMGMIVRTRLLRGAALTDHSVTEAPAVERGGRVIAVTRVGGIEVQAGAMALQEGSVGQQVQIRTDAARAPVLATVLETGRVEIRP